MITSIANNSPVTFALPLGSIVTEINGNKISKDATAQEIAEKFTADDEVTLGGHYRRIFDGVTQPFSIRFPLVNQDQLSMEGYKVKWVQLEFDTAPTPVVGNLTDYDTPEEQTFIGLDLFRSIQTKRANGAARKKQIYEAVGHLQKAAEAGNVTAKRLICEIIGDWGLDFGFGLRDEARLPKLMQTMADQEHSVFELDLARYHLEPGLMGLKRNPETGKRSLAKHTGKRNIWASAAYGFSLLKYPRNREDLTKALNLLEGAHERGLPYASFILGYAYASDNFGITADIPKAKLFLNAAAKGGIRQAKGMLDDINNPRTYTPNETGRDDDYEDRLERRRLQYLQDGQ